MIDSPTSSGNGRTLGGASRSLHTLRWQQHKHYIEIFLCVCRRPTPNLNGGTSNPDAQTPAGK